MLADLVSEEGVLHVELVVLDADDVYRTEIEVIEVGGIVLAGGVVPKHNSLGGESVLSASRDGGQVSH